MVNKKTYFLSPKKRYLQIALNSTLDEAHKIISQLPISDRIIIEAGTPLIKRYGQSGIRQIRDWYAQRLGGQTLTSSGTRSDLPDDTLSSMVWRSLLWGKNNYSKGKVDNVNPSLFPYVIADLKMMDRGETEVEIAANGGASAAVALGHAPIESLNAFVDQCEELGLDAMIDMINVEYPLAVLRQLKKLPRVVVLHRGVDEEKFNKEKQIPLHEIRRIKGGYDMLIAIAGGDTLREAQRAIFNDADIVVVWKSFFQSTGDTAKLAEEFLKEIK